MVEVKGSWVVVTSQEERSEDGSNRSRRVVDRWSTIFQEEVVESMIDSQHATRRDVLKALGAAGTVSLAGCLGGNEDSGSGGNREPRGTSYTVQNAEEDDRPYLIEDNKSEIIGDVFAPHDFYTSYLEPGNGEPEMHVVGVSKYGSVVSHFDQDFMDRFRPLDWRIATFEGTGEDMEKNILKTGELPDTYLEEEFDGLYRVFIPLDDVVPDWHENGANTVVGNKEEGVDFYGGMSCSAGYHPDYYDGTPAPK